MPKSETIRYQEGNVFLVPLLRPNRFARGLVARKGKRDGVIFAYFFGPALTGSVGADCNDINPSSFLIRTRLGHYGVKWGEWPLLGALPGFDRELWPMPKFYREVAIGPTRTRIFESTYSEDNPLELETTRMVESKEGLVSEGFWHHEGVSSLLTSILIPKSKVSQQWLLKLHGG